MAANTDIGDATMENKDCKLNISDNQLDLIDEIGPDEEIGTTIQTINEPRVLSPLRQNFRHFVSDRDRVLFRVSHASLQKRIRLNCLSCMLSQHLGYRYQVILVLKSSLLIMRLYEKQ